MRRTDFCTRKEASDSPTKTFLLLYNLPKLDLTPKVTPPLEFRTESEVTGLDGPQVDFRPRSFSSFRDESLVLVKIKKALSIPTHLDLDFG